MVLDCSFPPFVNFSQKESLFSYLKGHLIQVSFHKLLNISSQVKSYFQQPDILIVCSFPELLQCLVFHFVFFGQRSASPVSAGAGLCFTGSTAELMSSTGAAAGSEVWQLPVELRSS